MAFSFKGSEIPNLMLLGEASASSDFFKLVERAPLFSKATPSDVRLISTFMQLYRVGAETPFIAEGDLGDFMVFLLEGEVDVIKDYRTPKQKLIATVGPGKTLGEMSMIDGEPRFATCVANAATTFAILTRQRLLRLIEEHPALGSKILLQLVALLNQRLRVASTKLVEALDR
jgi:CRP/FNR family cyclic AMP-dependent transcriptional regulator